MPPAPQIASTENKSADQAVGSGNSNSPSNQDNEQQVSRRERLFFAWSEVLLALAITIATVAGVCVSNRQWEAMNQTNVFAKDQLEAVKEQNSTLIDQTKAMVEQTKLARGQLDQMELEQRPWIGIDTTTVEEFKDDAIKGWITMKNYGSNPAFVYANRMIAIPFDIEEEFLEEIATVDPDQPKDEFMQMVIPPGQVNNFPISGKTLSDRSLPPNWAKEVANGKRPYYVVVAIFYKVAAEIRHVTGSCLIYDPGYKQLRQHTKFNYLR